MKLIHLKMSGSDCYYPAHQILFIKRGLRVNALRFSGDICTYYISDDDIHSLLTWLTFDIDTVEISIEATLSPHAP